jgi:hypothetical protein
MELMISYSQNPNLGTWNVNSSANRRGGNLEISIVMGKFGMELNCERAWTSLTQDFSITPSDKLGLRSRCISLVSRSKHPDGSTLRTAS